LDEGPDGPVGLGPGLGVVGFLARDVRRAILRAMPGDVVICAAIRAEWRGLVVFAGEVAEGVALEARPTRTGHRAEVYRSVVVSREPRARRAGDSTGPGTEYSGYT
jgi:hypothetical protein